MPNHNEPAPLRVPFDSLTLAAVTAELRPLLVGGQIQDIRQPEPNELLLAIRSQGRSLTLLLSSDARFARVHLTTERKPNAATPSAFCLSLRRHLENGRITDVRQRQLDRIFELDVQSLSEDGTPAVNTLIAEVMGKHSNLILVSERGIVLEAAKRISNRINRFRETLPGKPYLPPPIQAAKQAALGLWADSTSWVGTVPLDGETRDSFARILSDTVAGMSPFLAKEIAYRTFLSAAPQRTDLLAAWNSTVGAVRDGSNRPCLLQQQDRKGAYAVLVLHTGAETRQGNEGLNALLDTAFRSQIERADREVALHELSERLRRELTRLEKQIGDAERTLRESKRADDYREQGELLLAHLWKIEPGAAQTVVQDFYSPQQSERTILLDPKLNPQENAQAYFRRARKSSDALEHASKQISTIRERLTRLEAAFAQHRQNEGTPGYSAAEARAFQRSLLAEGILREERSAPGVQPTGPDFQGHKIRRYTTPDGYEIYCGETATANDFLTTRVASPNDLWLHVRASAGSHVVIRTKGEPDRVPPEVLHRAALIAALHSNQKHSGLVPVDYTLKKYVRKPRGAAPGSVEVQREKTLHVAPQDAMEES